jgi:hypothetical protein
LLVFSIYHLHREGNGDGIFLKGLGASFILDFNPHSVFAGLVLSYLPNDFAGLFSDDHAGRGIDQNKGQGIAVDILGFDLVTLNS